MDLNALNSISLLETKIAKPIVKLQNFKIGEQQATYPAKIVPSKFQETVLLELEKNIVFLPQRVTNEYNPYITSFVAEKHALISKDVEKPHPAASLEIIESK
ncbi:hypothetical protein JTB14_013594 [Gonioctena quinquepunctata]|nr:hypothetical protein JTB14_013594 [Gonioctena quinquepunctata]